MTIKSLYNKCNVNATIICKEFKVHFRSSLGPQKLSVSFQHNVTFQGTRAVKQFNIAFKLP